MTQTGIKSACAPVLLIEDEPAVLEFVRSALERNGYSVVCTESGAQALQLLATDEFHGVVSDMRTPGGVDGAQVHAWIVANRPNLAGKVVFIPGDIANEDCRTVGHLDWNVVQVVDIHGAAIRLDIELEQPHLGSSRGKNQVLIANRGRHIRWSQPCSLQCLRVQVYLDLALLAAIGVRNSGAFNRDQLRAKKILSPVIKFLLGHSLSR